MEILKQLERMQAKFPEAAVAEAVAARQEVTPALLTFLENPDKGPGLLFAMYLLAEFREVRAYPALVRVARWPGEELEEWLGDVVIDDLGRMLASVCGGEWKDIQELIEDTAVDQWARGAALDACVALVVSGQKSREAVMEYFGSLLQGGLERTGSAVWDSLMQCLCDLYPQELMGEIDRAFQDGLVDEEAVSRRALKDALAGGKEKALARLAVNGSYQLIQSAAQEMKSWAFDPTMAAKVGRNDPCPCGSGKKYKKCHGT